MSSNKKPYFPMFVDLSDKKVLVFGAGTIAKRRIRSLSMFTNHLTVIAPEVNQELLSMEKEGLLTILKKKYQPEDIPGADLVIAATNDHQTNNEIYSICRQLHITVNVCSDKSKCDFYFPGIVSKENLVVGITASVSNHKAAREASDRIRELFSAQ